MYRTGTPLYPRNVWIAHMKVNELWTAIVISCRILAPMGSTTAQFVTWVKTWKMAHIQNYASQTRIAGPKTFKLEHVYEEWTPKTIVYQSLAQESSMASGMSAKERIMWILGCIYTGRSIMIYTCPSRQCQVVLIFCMSGRFWRAMKIFYRET